MTQPILRCPFCGGAAHSLRCFHEDLFFVACSFCGNRTPFYDNPKKARKAWNRRHTV